MMAGLQVPVMPLFEVSGNEGAEEFLHNGPICAKAGVIVAGVTLIIRVAVVAHWPAVGVKVYVVVAVLFKAGDHVPVIPFREVVGNGESVAPEQIAGTAANVGVTFGITVIINVAVVAH